MDLAVAAAHDLREAEPLELQAARVLLEDDAAPCDTAGLLDHRRRDGCVVGHCAQRRETAALEQRMPEHRIEVDDVDRVILLLLQVREGIRADRLDAAHGLLYRPVLRLEVREAVADDRLDERLRLDARDLSLRAHGKARDDRIGAEAERAVEHAHAVRKAHGLDQDEVDPVALAQSLAREIRARHIGDLRVLRRPFCQGDGIIRALAARRCDCLNHRIILQIYKIKSQSRCA